MEISRLFALTGLETGLRRNQQVDITSSTSTVPYESSEVDNHRLVKKVTPSEKELWLGPQDSSDVRAQVKSKNANNGAKGKKYRCSIRTGLAFMMEQETVLVPPRCGPGRGRQNHAAF